MATLLQLRTRVRWRFGNRRDLNTVAGEAILDGHINDAYLEIAHEFNFHVFEALVFGFQYFANIRNAQLASAGLNIYNIISVFDTTNNNHLTAFSGDFSRYEEVNGNAQPDNPREFLYFGDSLYLDPTPKANGELRIGLVQEPTLLSVPDQIPQVPLVYHKLIELYATRNIYNANNEETRALALERGEIAQFKRNVKSPRAKESYLPKRRAIRVKSYMRDRRLGV